MGKIEHYEEAKRRGVGWLLRQMNPDGSVGDVQKGVWYFRVPWTFAVAGETRVALRVVNWIRSNMFSENGDFSGKYPLGDPFASTFASYPLSTLIYGAQILRQFDITNRGMRHLLSYRDAATGGYFNSRDDKSVDAEMELFPTCQAGLSCIATGNLEEARLAARFVKTIWEAQPDREAKLYVVYTGRRGLVTEFPPEKAIGYVIQAQEPRQAYVSAGIATAFLCRLFMATGEESYLELAKQYQHFAMNCTERQFEVVQCCKSGWGSALLYQITGERKYLEWTYRVGDYFVSTQNEDGHWRQSEFLDPGHQLHLSIMVTAELAVHLDSIIGCLASAEV